MILRNETKILFVFHLILSSWIYYSKYLHKQLFLIVEFLMVQRGFETNH